MKTKLLIALTFLVSFAMGQTVLPKDAPFDQLIDFGETMKMANAVMVGNKIFPSSKCSGYYTVIIADLGEYSSNLTAPKNCIKFYFVDFNATYDHVEFVPIKDKYGNFVPSTTPIGNFSTGFILGTDGNYYVGTGNENGGHVLKIDYKNRSITDLGVPYNFTGAPNLTSLSVGTDGTINGIINSAYGSPAYSFKYDYGCDFKNLDPTPIDNDESRIKIVSNDATHLYAVVGNKVAAINIETRVQNEISFSYLGVPLNDETPIELHTFLGDYVYARVSNFNGPNGSIVYWKLKNGQIENTSNLGPWSGNYPTCDRTDALWYTLDLKQFENTLTPVLNQIERKLSCSINGIVKTIDLANYLVDVAQITSGISPFQNSVSQKRELFVSGAKYSMNASLDVPNGSVTKLGSTSKDGSTLTPISDFNPTNVLLFGYPGNIYKFSSLQNWNIHNSVTSPDITAPSANPIQKYFIRPKENSINGIYGPYATVGFKKISSNMLVLAGSNARDIKSGDPYYSPYPGEHLLISLIRTNLPTSNAITNIYSNEFDNYVPHSMDVNKLSNHVVVVGASKPTYVVPAVQKRVFILDTNGSIIQRFDFVNPANADPNSTIFVKDGSQIKVFGKTLYFMGEYTNLATGIRRTSLFRIQDYTISTVPEVVCSINGLGSFTGPLEISPDGTHVWILVEALTNNGDKKLLSMPSNTTNAIYDANCNCFNNNQVLLVPGIIPNNGKGIGYPQIAYMDVDGQGYVLVSGFTHIWGFKPSAYQGNGFSGQ